MVEELEKRLISRTEAAKRLGVSPAIVASYAEQGLIKETSFRGKTVIDSVSIDNLMATEEELADFKERINTHREIFIARMKRLMETDQAEFQKKKQEYRKRMKEINEFLDSARQKVEFPELVGSGRITRSLIISLMKTAQGDEIDEKKISIVEMFLEGKRADAIAKDNELTVADVKETIMQLIENMERLIEYPELEKRIEELSDDNESLMKKNSELMTEIERFSHEHKNTKNRRGKMNIEIGNPKLNLSVRATNVLLANGIKTVYDAQNLSYREMQKWRGMGEKSLKDIEECLQKFGVTISHSNAD